MRIPLRLRYTLLLIVLGLFFYLPGIGGVRLFDWDEINFAEISREMIVLGDYLRVHVDFQPFWEKPPLFFWLQALAMQVWGIGEFAARLPNVINGILTMVVVFWIGTYFYNVRFGLFWALSWLGSLLPFLYARSGIIDPWFNLFIFIGIMGLIRFHNVRDHWEEGSERQQGWKYLIGGGIAIGLAMLTKGPVALLIVGLVQGVYWVWHRFRRPLRWMHIIIYCFIAVAVMGLWLGIETWQNGDWFLRKFISYQYRLFSTPDAGHKGFPGFHVIVLLVGVFPASVFAMRAFFKMPVAPDGNKADLVIWMKILFWVVLILFSIVQSKIVHYSSLAYLPMTFLSALVLNEWWEGRLVWTRWMRVLLITIGSILAGTVALVPWIGSHLEKLKPLLHKDPFAVANLEANIEWTGWEAIPALVLLTTLFLSFRYFSRAMLRWGIPVLFIGTALFTMTTLFGIIRNVEAISQGAAMDFFEDQQGRDIYLHPVGYKTYGHLFYSRKPAPASGSSPNEKTLLTGHLDKQAVFITRINKTDRFTVYPDVVETGRRNGFVFYRREPSLSR